MEQKIVGVKELHTNFTKIVKQLQQGRHFLIMRHTRQIGRLLPPTEDDVWRQPEKTRRIEANKTVGQQLLDDLKNVQFSDPQVDPNLSKKVDEIVYGL